MPGVVLAEVGVAAQVHAVREPGVERESALVEALERDPPPGVQSTVNASGKPRLDG